MEILNYLFEEWRDIKGYEGLYQISNYGRVKSLDRIVRHGKGNYCRVIKSRILKNNIENNGYYCVVLSKNGKTKTYTVHNLVAFTFLPNPNNLPCVDHKDGNKLNNIVWINKDGSIDLIKTNLKWCTYKENANNPNTVLHMHSWEKGHIPWNVGLKYKHIKKPISSMVTAD